MGGSLIGERFACMSFGESHGKCVGMIIDGCPAGLELSESDIQPLLDLRRPGQTIIATQRKEEDKVEILSGVFEGFTTGAPICMLIWNRDSNSRSYDAITTTPRPGHSDYPAQVKYSGYADYRGGGRFSGRLTATFVMAGAVAQKLLYHTLGIEITAYTIQIGRIRASEINLEDARKNRYTNDIRCPDLTTVDHMREAILQTKKEGDSLGGVIECVCTGLPVGLGEPIFSSLEADISKAVFSIPAVKAVEFGSGFMGSEKKGSENNDLFTVKNGRIVTKTNNAGGILGGLSNGMPITMRIGFKPASSISRTQRTIDTSTLAEIDLCVSGRHDPCVVPRAPPVVESIVSVIIADHAIRSGFIGPVLKKWSKTRETKN
jgi:chorismate synthase